MHGGRFIPVVAALFLLSACGEPAPASTAVIESPPAAVDVLPCATAEAIPGRSARPATVATRIDDDPPAEPSDGDFDENHRGEMMRRQMAANDAYLDRRPLPESAVPGATRCAIKAEDVLRALHEEQEYDPQPVEEALVAGGLTDATVRRPATRDGGSGDGIVFAAWTGQACVVGRLSPTYGYSVEYGSTIADGGCLPAAD